MIAGIIAVVETLIFIALATLFLVTVGVLCAFAWILICVFSRVEFLMNGRLVQSCDSDHYEMLRAENNRLIIEDLQKSTQSSWHPRFIYIFGKIMYPHLGTHVMQYCYHLNLGKGREYFMSLQNENNVKKVTLFARFLDKFNANRTCQLERLASFTEEIKSLELDSKLSKIKQKQFRWLIDKRALIVAFCLIAEDKWDVFETILENAETPGEFVGLAGLK